MSNFMHKVKDAMTDRDGPATRSRTSDNRNHDASNPFTSDYNRSQNAPPMTKHGQNDNYPANKATGDYAGGPSPDTRNSNAMPGNTSSFSSNDINADPYRKNLANESDPQVDSDLDNRAKQGAVASAPQRSTAGDQGINSSNMPNRQQPYNQGVDNHTSSEDDFSKSTQEHRSHNQPGQYGSDANQVAGERDEDNYSTSTQEHKSHKTTSHVSPCPPRTMGSERMPKNSAGQEFDNRAAQPSFGGNAAGGSSYNENMGARGPDDMQTAAPLQKPGAGTGAGVNRAPEQQNIAGDQRVGD
ncbi:hypothetical protein N7532_002166 [Penicillium argentinense]|uniref:Uncharacterized protein n=1 Tax=Penicillium argentinense TaxID=1131581 RepID=A0A9W9KN44_9EURO|nr:uncharacterized protein N7532_002166 [Penicillium argentinense]KAJ5111631.1 hypothetical protein N7532_002166 [Penicillium argentinense]